MTFSILQLHPTPDRRVHIFVRHEAASFVVKATLQKQLHENFFTYLERHISNIHRAELPPYLTIYYDEPWIAGDLGQNKADFPDISAHMQKNDAASTLGGINKPPILRTPNFTTTSF